ncbi:hypothetical protein LOZ53_001287 [Ophidiomyces ophidiicola]|nr:hypothetical protein LOZ55_002516 [Ophidiomyces ophidiicola]KAI1991889.1 hypothetical protein LOZ51_004479 [Ophidiomyces ophidiicola]KAI1993025.1 hypothetical protein LOZ54_001523 [Ophidiomyces ophidiicola]KAI1995867.1 hypothetical protein LOZ53_001287 [Ophidiomyces ophidiicola]
MLHGREVLPPPNITRTGQQKPVPPRRPKPSHLASVPPPLPARTNSSQSPSSRAQPSPASFTPPLRTSSDSSFPTPVSSSNATAKHTVRAPAWGQTALPPLLPKRSQGNKIGEQGLSASRTVVASISTRLNGGPSVEAPPTGPPPSYEHSNGINGAGSVTAPKLPFRPKPSLVSLKSSGLVAENAVQPEAPSPPQRKLPPPPPPPAALEKIRAASFATLKGHDSRPVSNGRPIPEPSSRPAVPPPIPISSRPDLSKLQATKPRITPSVTAPSTQSDVCLKCRDFTAPDTHATRFPRQSLPTQELSWLALQLTAPFNSATDKARVLFTWLHHNIEYDVASFFNNNVKASTPENTLRTGLAVCEGYAGLFQQLATHAGLESRSISGHGKGYGFQKLAPGSPLPQFSCSHAWNVVRIDGGQWKLIDCCWGAGCVDGHNRPYIKRFDPEFFTMPNDEFGLRHYPSDNTQFYRHDGRPSISWEEYIFTNEPDGVDERLTIFANVAEDHGIGSRSFKPISQNISVNNPGPIHFEFSLICEHWTLQKHSGKSAPYVFMIGIHGADGQSDDFVTFEHVRGSRAGGGGDYWILDIRDPKVLGTPGQSLTLLALTSFGDNQDARGLTVREFHEKRGRVGMGWIAVSQWQLVA